MAERDGQKVYLCATTAPGLTWRADKLFGAFQGCIGTEFAGTESVLPP
jgi:hypothetical protein